MKTKDGYIRIKEKVYFEPKKLPKPLRRNYPWDGYHTKHYNKALKKYEASKQLIEVSNVTMSYDFNDKMVEPGWIEDIEEFINNNQPCEAEINGTAKIIKLL